MNEPLKPTPQASPDLMKSLGKLSRRLKKAAQYLSHTPETHGSLVAGESRSEVDSTESEQSDLIKEKMKLIEPLVEVAQPMDVRNVIEGEEKVQVDQFEEIEPVEVAEQAEEIEQAGIVDQVQEETKVSSEKQNEVPAWSSLERQIEPAIEDKMDWEEEMLGLVMEECDDHMSKIQTGLNHIKKAQPETIANVYRSVHTLKGSLGQIGALRARGVFHAMENLIEEIRARPTLSIIEPRLPLMMGLFDVVQTLVDGLKQKQTVPLPQLSDELLHTLPVGLQQSYIQERKQSSQRVPEIVNTEQDMTVRVRTSLVDFLLNQAQDVRLGRIALKRGLEDVHQLIGDLEDNGSRLSYILREFEMYADSQIQAKKIAMEQSLEGFDPLEFDTFTRLQELSRSLAEGLDDLTQIQRTMSRTTAQQETRLIQQDRMVEDIVEGLRRTRLTSVEKVLEESLTRVVRQTAREVGKEVQLHIQGQRVESDRVLLGQLQAPLSHMLRNALSHGIEKPEQRHAQGKAAEGRIDLLFQVESGRLKVTCKDDGAGLNLAVIGQKARERGLWTSTQNPSVEQAVDLICSPGFSTAESVSEIAGRGVGMDVVRTSILELGGRFQIHSVEGQGMTIVLSIPTELSNLTTLMVRSADQGWALPGEWIHSVHVVPKENIIQARENQIWKDEQGQSWPFMVLSEYLGLRHRHAEPPSYGFVVLVRDQQRIRAVEVDKIEGVQDLPLRPLGKVWSRQPGFLGAVLLPEGTACFVLDVLNLTRLGMKKIHKTGDHAQQESRMIVWVDDSLAVRKHASLLIREAGYEPLLAKDGREGLEMIAQHKDRICLVISDVEMPHMDGFEMVRQLKLNPQTQDLPIIMATSRTADKHRQHASNLGVQGYLSKPVQKEEWWETVRPWLKK